jgi:AcrR family transcriptional regulator
METIRETALREFNQHGYHGTSVRDIARGAGLTVAALYYHFSNKHEILFFIMRQGGEDIVAEIAAATETAPDDPVARLAAMVRAYVLYHCRRQAEAFIANSELRSLEPEAHKKIIAIRDEIERRFRVAVQNATSSGCFPSTDPKEACRAILAMSTSVADWYKPGGVLTAEQVAEHHVTLALQMLGHQPTTLSR